MIDIATNKSTKLLFVYTNINGFHEDCYSFGLAHIISMIKQHGFDSKAVIVQTKDEYAKVLKEVDEFQPKVIGFTSVSSQFHIVSEIATLIKAKDPNIVTVCGGVHPTIYPQCILETDSLDGIFCGESEHAFLEFVELIEEGEPIENCDNFAYSNNGELVVNKRKPLVHNLEELPYPDRDIYPFRETLKAKGYAQFFFTRGCPYLCTYCANQALGEAYGFKANPVRYRSPESCIQEIEEMAAKYPVQKLFIEDDIFGIDKKWRREFCELYAKRVKIKFMVLLRCNVMDDEFMQLLLDAGCTRILIGLESGNDYIRNTVMKRGMHREQIIKAFTLVKKYKLETTALNIIGVPGETEEMLWDTINLNKEIQPTNSGCNIFYPYKGTKLGDYCFENDLVDLEIFEDFSAERRETVLKYPQEWKDKLVYYQNNWESLIYPDDIYRNLRKKASKTAAWKVASRVKRSMLQTMGLR